jgi:quinol-cytochrome oxidoreductase complex cytochrome b subunit
MNVDKEQTDKDMPKGPYRERKQYVYPDLVFNGIVMLYLIMGILITLAIVKPFGLGDVADPLRSPEVIKPEWYFLAFYQFINYLPKGVGTGFVFLGIFLFCFWPLLPGVRGKYRAKYLKVVGVLFVLSYVFLGVIGYLAESDRTILGRKYHFDMKGVPHVVQPDSSVTTGGPGDTSGRVDSGDGELR